MVKIEHLESYCWTAALRGMRNPLNSWEKADSKIEYDPSTGAATKVELGPNDLGLAKRLTSAGPEHRKFLRQIAVTMDLTIPIYLVQEFDTYKIGTTRDSCSFQHKGASRNFTFDDFTFDDFNEIVEDTEAKGEVFPIREDFMEQAKSSMLANINWLRKLYVDTKDYRYFRLLRQLVPMGLNVKFTWSANYEILLNMHKQRRNHKLKEWHEICAAFENQLPCFKMFAECIENRRGAEQA